MSRRFPLWFWMVTAATLWAAFSCFYHLASLPPQAWVGGAWPLVCRSSSRFL